MPYKKPLKIITPRILPKPPACINIASLILHGQLPHGATPNSKSEFAGGVGQSGRFTRAHFADTADD